MLKRILITLLGLLVLLAVVGLFLPDNARMERSVVVSASADRIFPKLNSLKAFRTWSPWYAHDPDMILAYEGPEAGVGAVVRWESEHPKVGSGTQEIVESRLNEFVRSKLDFGAQGNAEAWFQLVESRAGGPKTTVTWGFETRFGYNLIGRYFGLVLESMLAGDYETGLEKLRTVVENEKD